MDPSDRPIERVEIRDAVDIAPLPGVGGPTLPWDARRVQQYLRAASILSVTRMLVDENTVIRLLAVKTLEEMEDPGAVFLLRRVADDKDEEVRTTALKVLQELQGAQMGSLP